MSSSALSFVDGLHSKPEEFFTTSTDLAKRLKKHLKTVFEHAAGVLNQQQQQNQQNLEKNEKKAKNTKKVSSLVAQKQKTSLLPAPALDELYVDGFDTEQLWGMLQMQHTPMMSALEAQVRAMEKDEQTGVVKKKSKEQKKKKNSTTSTTSTRPTALVEDDTKTTRITKASNTKPAVAAAGIKKGTKNSGTSSSSENRNTVKFQEPEEDDDEDEDDEEEEGGDSDMEAFLDAEDEAMNRILDGKQPLKKKNQSKQTEDNDEEEDEDSEEEEEIDFNAPIPYDEEEEKEENDRKKKKGLQSTNNNNKKKDKKKRSNQDDEDEDTEALQSLLTSGPRYEDFFGPRDEYDEDKKNNKKKTTTTTSNKSRKRSRKDEDSDELEDGRELFENDDDSEDLDKDENDEDIGSEDDDFIDKGLGLRDADYDNDEDDDEEDDEDDKEDGGAYKNKSKQKISASKHGKSYDDEKEAEEEEEDNDNDASRRAARRAALMDMDSPDDDDDQEDEEEDDEDEKSHTLPLTSHQLAKKKLALQVAVLESEAMTEKPWELRGEIGSGKRPENSLLSAELDFQQATKATPVVTVETTIALENLIRQRIRDNAFDDPIQKQATPAAYADAHGLNKSGAGEEKPELSSEKSKDGLGDLYATEYASRAMGVNVSDEKVKILEQSVLSLLEKVNGKLDALSNFHFTPKVATIPDMLITPNVPAISMEEALPMSVSEAQARAPEEVYGRKDGREGVLRSRGEKTSQQREADRRAKKRSKRKEKAMDEREEKMLSRANVGMGNPYSRAQALKDVKSQAAASAANGGGKNKRGVTVQDATNKKNTTTTSRDATTRMMSGASESSNFLPGNSTAAATTSSTFSFANPRSTNSTALFTKLQEEAEGIKARAKGDSAAAGGNSGFADVAFGKKKRKQDNNRFMSSRATNLKM